MATSLDRRIDRLEARRRDPSGQIMLKEARIAKGLAATPERARNYIRGSAEAVEPRYTEITFEQCARVENQLEKALTAAEIFVDFDHQGSVTSNTHIRVHSDIDLLVVTKKFLYVRHPLQAVNPYHGNPVDDLLMIRAICEAALAEEFPAADVDIMGGKAVSISGGSLSRSVDVVPSSWLDTEVYRISNQKRDRGICILDKNERNIIENFPFMHNARIDDRDRMTGGKLRRVIRLVKSIRSDSDEDIVLNSYDIVGLCYNIPIEKLADGGDDDVSLLMSFAEFALNAMRDTRLRDTMSVPNGTRLVFDSVRDAELLKLILECISLVKVSLGDVS